MNYGKFPASEIGFVKNIEKQLSANQLNNLRFKSPGLALFLSLFFGCLGLDRLYIGHIGLGILKFLTAGGFGFWWLIDLFLIREAARRENAFKLAEISP